MCGMSVIATNILPISMEIGAKIHWMAQKKIVVHQLLLVFCLCFLGFLSVDNAHSGHHDYLAELESKFFDGTTTKLSGMRD